MAKQSVKEFQLVIKEHQEFGDNGIHWDAEGREYFDPAMGGMQLAHDILEHPETPHSNGLVDEFQALGALTWIRFESGYSSKGSYGRHLEMRDMTSDISNLLRYDETGIPSPGKKVPHGCEKKDFFLDAVDQGIQEYYDEMKYGGDTVDKLPGYYRTAIANWMAIGYQAAQKRFKGLNRWEVCDLFETIEAAAQGFLNSYSDQEGFEAVLTVDFKNLTAYIEEKYDDYGYDDED